MTRWVREKGASCVFQLKFTSCLPQQTLMLSVTANKIQLINLLVHDLKLKATGLDNKLVVTAPDPTPFECSDGLTVERPDIFNTQEEADTIIVCQVNSQQNGQTVVVVADDTDMFLLLVHFVHAKSINCKVMVSPPVYTT